MTKVDSVAVKAYLSLDDLDVAGRRVLVRSDLNVPLEDGRVTDEMWQRMQDPLVIMPRRPEAATADHTEIYLPEQVIIFFVDDEPALISHMSSGTGDEWCEEVTISPGEYGNEEGKEQLKRGE